MRKLLAPLIFAGAMSAATAANAAPVTYQITHYSTPGYSASWLHTADGCASEGPSGGTLYMCSSNRRGGVNSITGMLVGDLDNGVLTLTDGILDVANVGRVEVLGGTLGGTFDDFWSIDTTAGTFLFENLAMGSDKPNRFENGELILWGQNEAAYDQSSHSSPGAWGIDLYAQAVPEPGTLGALALGGLCLFARRRRSQLNPAA